MSGAWELLAFAGVMALGQFSPGPDMILLTRTALKTGARTGVEMAMGIASGLAVHATLAVGGLALAFERLPILQAGLRWAAAIYLMWLAWRMLGEFRAAGDPGGALEVKASSSARNPFLRGLLCNLLNPKAAIFIAAVSAPFLRGAHPGWWPIALWGIVFVQACVLWSLWAYLLQWSPLRSRYEKSAGWIDLAFGATLAALAVLLLVG